MLFFVPNRVGVGVVSRGIQTLQTASIVREMWRLEDERDAEKLSFRLCKKKYQKYG